MMEITQQHTAAECDYYSQIVERLPDYIMYIDTGYFAARCTIGNVNKEKGRITYKLCPEHAELLREKIAEGMK